MSRNASRARKESPPSDASRRKAALKARSGIERAKPEPKPEAAPFPTGKGRKALKGISIYMNPLAKDVLDKIAKEQQRTVQDLGLEALNLLFRRYGEKPIA